MSDNEFLLYPIEAGENPLCLGCGTQMTVATHEARETKLTSSHFDVGAVESQKSFYGINSAVLPTAFDGPQGVMTYF